MVQLQVKLDTGLERSQQNGASSSFFPSFLLSAFFLCKIHCQRGFLQARTSGRPRLLLAVLAEKESFSFLIVPEKS